MQPLFSETPVEIDFEDAAPIQDGDRVIISKPMLKQLTDFLGDKLPAHLSVGQSAKIEVLRETKTWKGKTEVLRTFVGLMFGTSGKQTKKEGNVTLNISYNGSRGVYVTREFLVHLKSVRAWELVP